jgi:hypothetical protein
MDDMSKYAFDHLADRADVDHGAEVAADERDWIEIIVRRVSRFAGYASLAAAVAGLAYLAIR